MKRLMVIATVVAAMALGRAITDLIPVSQVSEAPFERVGELGRSLSLRYAAVEVPEVGVSKELVSGNGVFVAGGVFVVVPVAVTATDAPLSLLGPRLRDAEGIEYAPHTTTGCASVLNGQTGVKVWGTVCFDVPAEAVPGMQFVLSAGLPGTANDNDRDDEAVIDLGLTEAMATDPSPRLVGETASLERPELEPSR